MSGLVSGVESAVSSIFGGGQSSQYGAGTAPVYQPQNQGQFDTYYNQLIQQMMNNNPAANIYPQYQQYVSQIENNPYAAGAQTAANNAGAASTAVGNAAISNAGALTTAGNNILPYSQQILNTAFDPQDALYQRTLQQTQDQIRAGEASRGLALSPVGDALENQGLSNFNIDWQNNLLNRQTTGLTSAEGVNTNASGLFTDSANLGNAGVSAINSGGQLPTNTYTNNLANILNALNTQGSAGAATNAVPQQTLQDLLTYLGYSNQAAGTANNAAYQGFQNANTITDNLGAVAGAIGPSLGKAATGIGTWLSGLV